MSSLTCPCCGDPLPNAEIGLFACEVCKVEPIVGPWLEVAPGVYQAVLICPECGDHGSVTTRVEKELEAPV